MNSRILFLLVVLSIRWLASCSAQSGDVTHLPPLEFQKILNDNQVQLIDVRTPEEFAAGHLTGARNMDMQHVGFEQMISVLDTNRLVALYCLAGARSNQAAQFMRKKGFTKLYDLKGGLNAWNHEHLPVEGQRLEPMMTMADFLQLLPDSGWALVDFSAEWCKPCQQLKPVLAQFEKTYSSRVQVIRIDVDKEKSLSESVPVDEIPLLVLYHGDSTIWRGVGFMEFEALKAEVDKLLKK